METLWFVLVAAMVTVYVILDGFDLGAGVLHLWVARTEEERRIVLQSIGPVWDGNEVWLVAAGGSLMLSFPKLFASSFSGFYLPLMMVLWLLIGRACAIELRSHVDNALWHQFWDVAFWASSTLLPIFFGAALGNIVRGVPLGEDGYFFSALWSDFSITGPETGILDAYTVTVGTTALLALTVHGGLWLYLKTEGELQERAKKATLFFWKPLVVALVALTVFSFRIQPHLGARFAETPWGLVFPAIALAGLAGIRFALGRGGEIQAFLGSCALLFGMLTSVAFGLYPLVLPAIHDGESSLTVFNAAADAYSLEVALYWWIPGMLLAVLYTSYVYRTISGKTKLDPDAY